MKLRHLLLGRKVLTNPDSMLKSRDITLSTNVHIVKAMVFLVVMYRYESWTIKKAEHQRIDAFKLWCWRRLLRVSWSARKSKLVNPKGNQLWIFIGRTEAEDEAPKLWPPDEKSWLTGKETLCWERLKAKGNRGGQGWDGWMHHRLNGHESEQTSGDSREQKSLVSSSPRGCRELDTAPEQQRSFDQTPPCLIWGLEPKLMIFPTNSIFHPFI